MLLSSSMCILLPITKGYFNCAIQGWTSFCSQKCCSSETCSATQRPCFGKTTWLHQPKTLERSDFPRSCHRAGAPVLWLLWVLLQGSLNGLFSRELPLAEREPPCPWRESHYAMTDRQGTNRTPCGIRLRPLPCLAVFLYPILLSSPH